MCYNSNLYETQNKHSQAQTTHLTIHHQRIGNNYSAENPFSMMTINPVRGKPAQYEHNLTRVALQTNKTILYTLNRFSIVLFSVICNYVVFGTHDISNGIIVDMIDAK